MRSLLASTLLSVLLVLFSSTAASGAGHAPHMRKPLVLTEDQKVALNKQYHNVLDDVTKMGDIGLDKSILDKIHLDGFGKDSYAEKGGKVYDTVHLSGLQVEAEDNVILSMDCTLALSMTIGERFPVLVFPNSWGMPQIEYILRIHDFAKRGYITCEYETRGWYKSGGTIDTAGALDRSDTTTVINYIQAKQDEWQVNTTHFAFVGISYGAGLSLMAAGQNPDVVKTAVAMSGWGKLNEGFFYHNTPNNGSLTHLYNDGKKDGKVAASLEEFYQWVTAADPKHMGQVWDFIHSRSPEHLFLDAYNSKNIPIFLSNNQDDQFFYPQAKAEFFNKLTCPKFQLINQGGHAIPEAVGLFVSPNYIWTQVEKWVDYWLKGIDTGIMDEPNVQVQDSNTIWGQNTSYLPLDHWGDKKIQAQRLYFSPTKPEKELFPDLLGFGSLADSAPEADPLFPGQLKYNTEGQTMSFGWRGQTIQEIVGLDPELDILEYKPFTDLMFQGPQLTESVTACGIPNITLELQVPQTKKWQVYGVLYELIQVSPSFNLTEVNFTAIIKLLDPKLKIDPAIMKVLDFLLQREVKLGGQDLPHIADPISDFQLTYWGDYNVVNETSITIPDYDVRAGLFDTDTVRINNIACRTICHTFRAPWVIDLHELTGGLLPHGTNISLSSAVGVGFTLNIDAFTPAAKKGLEVKMPYGSRNYVELPIYHHPVGNGNNNNPAPAGHDSHSAVDSDATTVADPSPK